MVLFVLPAAARENASQSAAIAFSLSESPLVDASTALRRAEEQFLRDDVQLQQLRGSLPRGLEEITADEVSPQQQPSTTENRPSQLHIAFQGREKVSGLPTGLTVAWFLPRQCACADSNGVELQLLDAVGSDGRATSLPPASLPPGGRGGRGESVPAMRPSRNIGAEIMLFKLYTCGTIMGDRNCSL